MFTNQALILLTFLLPGFLSMAVLDMLTPASKRDNLQKIVNALIFSFVIYATYALILKEYPVLLVQKTIGAEKQYVINFAGGSILFLLIISILIPVALSASIKYDLHMRFFRWLRVTDRTSRTNVWFDVFTDIKSYIIINFEDGRRLYGWPEYFSDDPDDKSLFICHAAWVGDDGRFINLDNRGILITPNERIDTIEFIKKRKAKDE
ncbi:MAG: hypothetical protein BA865_01010 [Desulfobacterales bacterium S5133MH4]|nr:MAG: hypothetical protein BA865_01010 [Desulfobacterales bacterium S5133MH4]